MKKIISILFTLCLATASLFAQSNKKSPISQEEFRAKQEAFIIEKANLNKEEATKFFPVYFELQDKKKRINDRMHNAFKKGKDPETTDAEYEVITTNILNDRIASNELERSYYEKFKKILPPKKIFRIQHAEMKFHRELLKNVNKKKHN